MEHLPDSKETLSRFEKLLVALVKGRVDFRSRELTKHLQLVLAKMP